MCCHWKAYILVLMMNETVELLNDDHDHGTETSTATVAVIAGICSLVFGLVAFLTNSVLLFTLYKDPYNYFRSRATTYFVASLSVSDFLGGVVVQPMYAACMLGRSAGFEQTNLCDITLIFSHASTKISIIVVVVLSLERYLAVKLSRRYKRLVTVRKAIICDIVIWLFCAAFEALHSISESEEIFHEIDLHLQTTVPLSILCVAYTATYFEFRRYSRNVIFVRANIGGRSRVFLRNIRLEKKIVLTMFISLLPHLITNNLVDHCHEEDSGKCSEFWFEILRALSVPMLCLSCALNPFLYAWRIPQYRQALRVVGLTTS